MSNLIYLSVTGEKQGLISAGCSSLDSIGNKYQSAHENEIFVYELVNNISREENISLLPVEIRKPIDKATPLFARQSMIRKNWSAFFLSIERLNLVEMNFILR